MKTKVTILGESHEDVTPKKKIEFVGGLGGDGKISIRVGFETPIEYKEVILLDLNYLEIDGVSYDLFYCIHSNKFMSCLKYGHFNDGVV